MNPEQRLSKLAVPTHRDEQSGVSTISPRPMTLATWAREMWGHREVLAALTRKDFQVRYKRATFGFLWAVAVPLLQATILALVFSRIGQFAHQSFSYPAYVLAGVLAWSYLATTVTASCTSIVDGASLTDKVWFPRAILAIVPTGANAVALVASVGALIVALPLFGEPLRLRLLLLFPAVLLLLAFTTALGLVLSALNVYFRDVRHLVAAGLLMWFYATPIMYPPTAIGDRGQWLDFNPATGVIALFQAAAVGSVTNPGRAITVAVIVTIALLAAGVSLQRRLDRLFVDLL
jgi:ABC-type polysaccharide/polyol phosphate export permease